MEERRYYIYVLFDLKKYSNITLTEINQSFIFEPYYIGKGTENRYLYHKNIKSTKHKKDAKTKSLLNSGYKYEEITKVVIDNLTEAQAYDLERIIIELIGLENLTNAAPGGKGGYGSVHRGKTYEEIYGEERGKEIASKISESNTGKKDTLEQRKTRSDRMKEKFKDEEFMANHIKNITGRKMPDSFSESQSKRYKGVSYEERYGEERAKEISKKKSLASKGKKQSNKIKTKMAKGRAKYLWCVEFNSICYINLYRHEFIEIVGCCPFYYKDAIKILKKK